MFSTLCFHHVCHVVWLAKYPASGVQLPAPERTEQIMPGVCADFGCELAEFSGEPGHIHLLVNSPPTVAI